MTAANQEGPLLFSGGPDTAIPEVQLLSNGRYHVMVTSDGGGYSRWKNLAVTRWREDATCDNWGAFCYIRDVASGHLWSTTYQPTLQQSDTYEAAFATGRATFRRRDHEIETHTDIAVSPEDDIELRRVRMTNGSATRRVVDVTSYAEIVLAPPATDAAQPAFSKLFVETELLRERQAILCSRRPRAPAEPRPWMFQYTHAAVWAAMAFAALGDATRAWELFSMINPINHARSPDAIAVYKTEPYVLAGDVYALPPHTGRGGWAWYTGSAGWMYQFILESLLGLRLEVDTLHFSPRAPADWTSFTVRYRHRDTVYHITVLQTSLADGEPRLTVDGVEFPGQAISLVDDRRQHAVEVRIHAAHG